MVNDVKEILNNSVEVVIKSPQLSFKLMKCYSALFLEGKSPKFCAKKQRIYYKELLKNGIMKAELKAKIEARTLTPKFKGRIRRKSVFFDSAKLHDEKAIKGLIDGLLAEGDFKKLPAGYAAAKKEAAAKTANTEAKKKASTDELEALKKENESLKVENEALGKIKAENESLKVENEALKKGLVGAKK